MTRTEIEALIKKCEFRKLIKMCENSKEALAVVLKAIDYVGILEENILGYYACLSLLQLKLTNQEQASIHNTASLVLTQGINVISGAYQLGLYHAQMCAKLDPGNISYQQTLLRAFSDIPELKDERKDTEDTGTVLLS